MTFLCALPWIAIAIVSSNAAEPVVVAKLEIDTASRPLAIWRRGQHAVRVFMPELLPSLFRRTLRLEQPVPSAGSLDWILTGPEGGVTLQISKNGVRVLQRYYDSYGLAAELPPKARHPERIVIDERADTGEPVQSVTLELNHRMGLQVFVNGKPAIAQRCLMDLQRHQFTWTGSSEAAGLIRARIEAPPEESVRVTVDASQRRQRMLGFGGITSIPAYQMLSESGKRQWWELLREYNLLLHREYPNGVRLERALKNFDRLSDASPHYYGDNFPNGEISDFEYLRRVRQLGGKILFQFWELPRWARKPYTGAAGKVQADAPDLDEYTRAMIGYCRLVQQRTGAAPEIVGVQNEITLPGEVWARMTVRLREALDKAGFGGTKIHMPDASRIAQRIEAAVALRRETEAWRRIDFAATHMYDFQSFFEKPDEFDTLANTWSKAVSHKEFLSTELAVNVPQWQSGSYRTAFAMAQLYHKNLTLMNASALLYCWLLLDVEQPTYGATRSLFVPDRKNGFVPAASSHQLRVFGAFSRHIREGAHRVHATSSSADVLVSAFESGTTRTLVVVNRGLTPRALNIDWPGVRLARAARVSM